MKYNSVKEYFENASEIKESGKEISAAVKFVIEKAIARVRRKARKIMKFVENDYSVRRSAQIDVRSFTKRLKEEQKMRKLREDSRHRMSLERIKEKDLIYSQEQIKSKEQKEFEYKNHINSMRESSDKRKTQIRQAKSELRGLPKQIRLYNILNENFSKKVVQAELESRMKFLEERKKKFLPINNEKIIDHSKNHSTILKKLAGKYHQKKSKRPAHLYQSAWIEKVKQQEMEEKEKKERIERDRRSNLERKSNYSQLVQEIHPPKIDELKRKELQIIKERILLPVKRKIYSNSSVSRSRSVMQSIQSVKSKPASIATLPFRNSRINYLSELRNSREERLGKLRSKSFDKQPLTKQEIIKQANQMEKLANQHEQILKHPHFQDWGKIIRAEEDANSLLLESVRSKLSLLHDMTF